MNVICHISGPSGSGKTTLLNKIQKLFPNVVCKDLDELDEQAENILGYSNIKKKNYSDKMLKNLFNKRQELLNKFVKNSNKPIILGGHHTEGRYVLDIHTDNKFRINIGPITSAYRAYLRSQKEDPKYKRTLDELPFDIKEAKETIDELNKLNYEPKSTEEIIKFISNLLE